MDNKTIKSLIVLHGIDTNILSEKLNINRSTLSLKINGKREFTQSELETMADYFNVTIDYLLERSK